MLIGSGIIKIAVRMKRSQLSEDLPQFQINIEGSEIGRFDKRLQPGTEAIQSAQAHHLFELDASHGVDAESPARNLERQVPDGFPAPGCLSHEPVRGEWPTRSR